MRFDCIILGGGIAGLQAAIQLGRYEHRVAVIDANRGRSRLCHNYHNLLGWPDGISGPLLRELGEQQARLLDVEFVRDEIIRATREASYFVLSGRDGMAYEGRRLLIATGIVDNIPNLPGLPACLGETVFVCPDCDGYEVRRRRTIVLGRGHVGAEMALTLRYWTDDIVFVDSADDPLDKPHRDSLSEQNCTYVHSPVVEFHCEGAHFQGVTLADGRRINGERGFVAYGGNQVQSDLAATLGVTVGTNRHIVVDPRTKRTNQSHIWAAGDVVAHSEQVSIAMGDGSQAAIWIHKSLMS